MKIWARTYDQKVPPSYSSLNQLCLLTLGPHQEGLLAQSHLPPSRMKATSPARTLTPGCKPSPSELRSPSTTLHGQEAIDIKHSHNFPYPICICGYQKNAFMAIQKLNAYTHASYHYSDGLRFVIWVFYKEVSKAMRNNFTLSSKPERACPGSHCTTPQTHSKRMSPQCSLTCHPAQIFIQSVS